MGKRTVSSASPLPQDMGGTGYSNLKAALDALNVMYSYTATGANLLTTSKGDFTARPPWSSYTQGGGVNPDSATAFTINGSGNNTQNSYAIAGTTVAGTYKLTITATRTSGGGNLVPNYYEGGDHLLAWDQGNTWVTGTKRTVTVTFSLTASQTNFGATVGYFNDPNTGSYQFDLQPDGGLYKLERMS